NLVGSSKNIVVAMLVGASKFTFLSQGFGMSSQTNMAIDLVGGPSPENVTLDFTGSTIRPSLVTVRGELNGGNNACATTGPAALTDSIFDLNLGMGVGNTNAAYNDGGGVVTRSTLNVRFVGGDLATTGDTATTTFKGHVEDHSRVYVAFEGQQGNDKYFGNYDLSTFGIDTASTGSEMSFGIDLGNGFHISKTSANDTTGPATINGALIYDITMGQQPDAANILLHNLTGSGIIYYSNDGGWANDKLNATVTFDATSTNQLWLL